MMNETVVLLIEDNPAHSLLVMELVEGVEKTGRLVPPLAWESVTTLKKGLARLAEGGVDLVLLDLGLPDSRGLDTFLKAFDQNPAVPYVIISGYDDEELAIQALREGAQDYLVKDELDGPMLLRTMLYAIERTQAEGALKESEEKFRVLVETSRDLIWNCDTEGRFTYLNPAWERTHGYRIEEMLGHKFTEFQPPEVAARDIQEFSRHLAGGSVMSYETTYISKSGDTIHLVFNAIPTVDASGSIVGAQGTAYDITERRALEQKITEISERERIRIGQDLHDGLGQFLAGIKYMTDVLEKNLAEKAMEEVISVREITKRLDEAIQQTKTLAREIYPVKINAEGFMSVLQEYAMQVNRMYGVRCQLEVDQPLLIQDHSVATHLFRIVQEAVNNAVHHASADQITIQIAVEDGLRSVRIRDNGVGLPEQFEKLKGVGVNSMKYRANVIGASFSIASKGTNGTVVACTWQDGQFLDQPSEK